MKPDADFFCQDLPKLKSQDEEIYYFVCYILEKMNISKDKWNSLSQDKRKEEWINFWDNVDGEVEITKGHIKSDTTNVEIDVPKSIIISYRDKNNRWHTVRKPLTKNAVEVPMQFDEYLGDWITLSDGRRKWIKSKSIDIPYGDKMTFIPRSGDEKRADELQIQHDLELPWDKFHEKHPQISFDDYKNAVQISQAKQRELDFYQSAYDYIETYTKIFDSYPQILISPYGFQKMMKFLSDGEKIDLIDELTKEVKTKVRGERRKAELIYIIKMLCGDPRILQNLDNFFDDFAKTQGNVKRVTANAYDMAWEVLSRSIESVIGKKIQTTQDVLVALSEFAFNESKWSKFKKDFKEAAEKIKFEQTLRKNNKRNPGKMRTRRGKYSIDVEPTDDTTFYFTDGIYVNKKDQN